MQKNLAILIFIVLPALFYSNVAGAFLLAGLSDAEQTYHSTLFNYAMDSIPTDQSFDWSSYSGKGTFTVGAPFVSKSNANCRDYTEAFEVQGNKGSFKGVGCKRAGDDGWCQLKPTDALTCAMEQPAFMIGGMDYSVPLPSVNANATLPDVSIGGGNVNINAPNINTHFGTGRIGSPNVTSGTANNNNNSNGTNSADKNKGGQASGVANSVTGTLGEGAAKGTGLALGWFQSMFR